MGSPEVIVVDSGTEFIGCVAEARDDNGITLLPCDAKAPW